MSPTNAIAASLKKSFVFHGRIGRSEYLWFLAFSILVLAGCLTICWQLRHIFSFGITSLIIVGMMYIPVTSAGVRRLHDVGETGELMLDPLQPSLTLVVLVGLANLAVYFAPALLALFFFALILTRGLLLWIGILILIIAAVVTLIFFTNTASKLLLPSQPGNNKYGPNPHEVQS